MPTLPGVFTHFGNRSRTTIGIIHKSAEWNQQRCCRVCGNTSRNAAQNPNTPSPIASTGPASPQA